MSEPQPLPMPPVTVPEGSPPDTGSVALATSTAQSMLSTAQSFMNSLRFGDWFVAPNVNVAFPTEDPAPGLQTSAMPALQTVPWTAPSAPAVFSSVAPIVANLLPGPFTGTPPTLSFGSLPAVDYGAAPAAPSVDLNYVMPTLSLSLPTAPALMQVDTVPFAGVTLPTFSAAAPTLTAVPPDVLRYVEGPTTCSSPSR